MSDRFAPIPCPLGKLTPRPYRIPAPVPQPLPMGREPLEGMLLCECPEATARSNHQGATHG